MLTSRQRRFADACLAGQAPDDAYRAAGYREQNAVAAARRLLKVPTVQAYMHEQDGAKDCRVADSDEILRFLTAVLRGEAGSEKDRLRAAELLGKRQGLFSEKSTSESSCEVVIVDDLGG